MIGKDQIAEACRYADAGAEEHGLDAYLASKNVDTAGLIYVAEQRAMRMVMIERGEDPRQIVRMTPIRFDANERVRTERYTVMFLDGFAAGLTVKTNGDPKDAIHEHLRD